MDYHWRENLSNGDVEILTLGNITASGHKKKLIQ